MATTSTTSTSATSRTSAGVAVLALLAVLDIAWGILAATGVLDSADAPPPAALIIFAALGAVTLVAARPALRGSRPAAWTVIGTRAVSALFADAPALVLDAPATIRVVVSVAIALAALGIWWTLPLVGRRVAADRVSA